MSLLTIDIIQNLINSMTPLIKITSIDDISVNEWKVNSCNTYWIRECREIDINGFKYTVGEVKHNESFTITPLDGAPKPTVTEFNIYSPAFYFGTRNKVNTDRQTDGNLDDDQGFDAITPFGFLLSRISENEPNDFNNPVLREANVRLFFLERYNLEDDTQNKTLLETVLRQLHSMADYFIKTVNDNEESFNCPLDIKRRQYEAFSEIGTDAKWYLDEPLASVELELTLPILKSYKCLKCSID